MKILIATVVGLLVFAGAYIAVKQLGQREAQRRANEEMNEFRKSVTAKAERDLDRDGVISTETSRAALSELHVRLDRLAAQGGSKDKEMKATAELMGELQQQTLPYLEFVKRIENDPPGDMSNVKTKADLAAKRELGKEVLRLNRELMAFLDSMEDRMWKKLQDAGVETGTREQFAAKTSTSFRRAIELQRQIRKHQETTANALLTLTDLLEAEWGKWKWKDDDIIFDNDAALTRYNGLMEELRKADDEQTALQREGLKNMQRK